MLAEPSDPIVLETLNTLRKFENRKQLQELPAYYRNQPTENQLILVKNWIEQCESHEELQEISKEYNNRIILNETEHALQAKNKRDPDNPILFLKYNQVAASDESLYFPQGATNPESRQFITDTHPTYIQSIAIVTAKGKNIYLAKHSLPDCISYIPGPAELQYIRRRNPSYTPDPALIQDTKLRPRSSSTSGEK